MMSDIIKYGISKFPVTTMLARKIVNVETAIKKVAIIAIAILYFIRSCREEISSMINLSFFEIWLLLFIMTSLSQKITSLHTHYNR